jgi:hypothetical protein
MSKLSWIPATSRNIRRQVGPWTSPGRRFGSVTSGNEREGLGSGFQEWRKMVKWILRVTCAARR